MALQFSDLLVCVPGCQQWGQDETLLGVAQGPQGIPLVHSELPPAPALPGLSMSVVQSPELPWFPCLSPLDLFLTPPALMEMWADSGAPGISSQGRTGAGGAARGGAG